MKFKLLNKKMIEIKRLLLRTKNATFLEKNDKPMYLLKSLSPDKVV